VRLSSVGSEIYSELAKVTGMTQRAISYYEIEAEFPPAPELISMPPSKYTVDLAGASQGGYLAGLAA
jgi:hypothetical protein